MNAAAEKTIELPRTHDLEFLARLVREAGVDTPSVFENIDWLSPWASDSLDDEPIDLDRTAALGRRVRRVLGGGVGCPTRPLTAAQGSIQGSVLSKSDPAEPKTTPATTGNPTQPDPPSATS